jgi:arylsulfatase A-like enzyme
VTYRRLRDAIVADVGRAIWIATGGCAAFGVVEYASALVSYAGSTPIVVKLRVLGVVAGLVALSWLAAVLGLSTIFVGARLARALGGGDPRAGRGVLAFPQPTTGPRTGPPRLWAAIVVAAVAILVVQRWALWVVSHHKEPNLVGLMIAGVAIALVPVVVVAYRAVARSATWLAGVADPVLGAWSPIGRWRGTGIAAVVMVTAVMVPAWYTSTFVKAMWSSLRIEQFSMFPPWRAVIPAIAVAAGGCAGAWWAARPRRTARPPRKIAAAAAVATGAVVTLALSRWGADGEARSVATTASPAFARIIDRIRQLNDLDGDGFGSLLGENDCKPFDAAIRPGVRDTPDNGRDENCDGHDFSYRDLIRVPGDKKPVPAAFRKPWNVVFLTIDTVRYDHTSFGGYRDGPRKRDTTPRLAELVKKSVSFEFAQAPSAGTMGSVPAIITSKFFHSGLALEVAGVRPGMPPRLAKDNVLIGEIMKRGGYTTGAILSHEYFNDWGMDQGIDSYDNELGKTGDPFKITSSALTDRALAWISRQHAPKWFLWVHYLDPHGRYVAHPDHKSFGGTEEDLYDGELAYTDLHVGRLIDELARLPGGDRTIIAITSDHGDGFGEHGFINHGQALYRELLHVPLIVYIPGLENQPRSIGGAVSAIDLVPTIADLCGIDVSDLSFEGESLVAQIFDGTVDTERVVFAETNYPHPIRAAISARQKLVFHLKSNLYELYDLTKDPWEKSNLWPREAAAGQKIRDALDLWLNRVVFARDPKFNQAAEQISAALVAKKPDRLAAAVAAPGATFDDGKIAVLGADLVDPARPARTNQPLDLHVYFEARAIPAKSYRFQVTVWPVNRATFDPTAAIPSNAARTPFRATLDGLFSTDRWRAGEIVRDKVQIKLPPDWVGDGLAIALAVDAHGPRVALDGGLHPGGDANVLTIGALPLSGSPPPPKP